MQNNDLENTKLQVSILNENKDYIAQEYRTLNGVLSLGVLANKLNGNDSIMYVLDNLKNIHDIEELKWHIQILKVSVHNGDYITNFIINVINTQTDWTISYKFNSLVSLASSIPNFDLIKLMKDKMEQN